MKNTRRTFLQSLASIPLLGWAFASAKPATPSLPPVKVDTSEPVYGFDERLMLNDRYGMVVVGDEIRRGDFVAFKGDDDSTLVRATVNSIPIGLATANIKPGDDASGRVLVRGWASTDGKSIPRPSYPQSKLKLDDDFWKDREWPDEPWNDDTDE